MEAVVDIRGERSEISDEYLTWCEGLFKLVASKDLLWAFAVLDHVVRVARVDSGVTEETWLRVVAAVAPALEAAVAGDDGVDRVREMLAAQEPRSLSLLIRRIGSRRVPTAMRVFATAAFRHPQVAYEPYVRQVLAPAGPRMLTMTTGRDSWELPAELEQIVPDVDEFWRVLDSHGTRFIEHSGLREDVAGIIERRRTASNGDVESGA